MRKKGKESKKHAKQVTTVNPTQTPSTNKERELRSYQNYGFITAMNQKKKKEKEEINKGEGPKQKGSSRGDSERKKSRKRGVGGGPRTKRGGVKKTCSLEV